MKKSELIAILSEIEEDVDIKLCLEDQNSPNAWIKDLEHQDVQLEDQRGENVLYFVHVFPVGNS